MLTKEMMAALEADGEKLRQLTGEDHGPILLLDQPPMNATELLRPLLALYSPEEVDEWLSSPQRLLGGQTPEMMIADGRQDEVRAVIDQIVSGAFI